MAERPAKRQRRSTIILSDDEEKPHTKSAASIPLRSSTRSNGRQPRSTEPLSQPTTPRKRNVNAASKTTPKSSPEKVRKTNDRKPEPPSKSLHNFFSKVTDEQRWQRKSVTPELEIRDGTFGDEIVDDDSMDDTLVEVANQEDAWRSVSASQSSSHDRTQAPPSSSQRRFVKPAVPVKSSLNQMITHNSSTIHVDHKPWADRYGPETLDELAVHKKKVGDVQTWLDGVFSGRGKQRLLVLKGPAGSGKTSTIALLAKARGINVVPWHNPTVSESGLATAIQQFTEFLTRGGDFESLEMQDAKVRKSAPNLSQRRVMLVEEFPTAMTRSSNILDTFRSVFLQYLASSNQSTNTGSRMSSVQSYPPIVMIISETLISSSTALTDSFTAHRLLGPELSNHPLVTMIEFNPVAATFVQKALDLVVKKEARDSKRRRIPGPAVMSKLAEVGDVRSAINSLEFFCARGDESVDWSGTVAGRARKKDIATLTELEKNTLQLVSQRESTLDMFHAAGKIVYNKREELKSSDVRMRPPRPPDHLMHLHRSNPSQVDVDQLLNETGTDIQTFVSTLHENYVLSCNGDDFVDSFESCSKILSDSDILNPDSRGLLRSKGSSQIASGTIQTGNSDMLRQDEISFHVASRGIVFSLPSPVQRAVPTGARKQDAFKMFYPASLRIWKPTEEVHDLLSFYINSASGTDPGSNVSRPSNEGVASWRSRTLASLANSTYDDSVSDSPDRLLSRQTSEHNQVLEILPFLLKIKAGKNEDVSTLRKITQFYGIHVSGEEPFEDDLETHPPSSKVSRTTNSSLREKVAAAHDSIRSQQLRISMTGVPSNKDSSNNGLSFSSETGLQADAFEKLYISDDDIQDD